MSESLFSPLPYFEKLFMFNFKKLIDAIELELEIKELMKLGLTEEEITGFIEVYYDSWIMPGDIFLN